MQSLQQGCQVDAAGDPCDLWDRRLLEGTKSGLVAAKLSGRVSECASGGTQGHQGGLVESMGMSMSQPVQQTLA